MTPHNKKLFRIASVLIITIAAVAYGVRISNGPSDEDAAPQTETIQTQSQSSLQEKPMVAEKSTLALKEDGWLTYDSPEYGFSFDYPPDTKVESREDTNYHYIRFQNYTPTTGMIRVGLGQGEYYLEIHIYDNSKAKPAGYCTESVVDAKEVALGSVSGYRGNGPVGGDAGGVRQALCAQKSGATFYVMGTENDADTPLVNQILDSFKFD